MARPRQPPRNHHDYGINEEGVSWEASGDEDPIPLRIFVPHRTPRDVLPGGWESPREFYILWDGAGPRARFKFKREHGDLVCHEVLILRRPDEPPISANSIRKLRLHEAKELGGATAAGADTKEGRARLAVDAGGTRRGQRLPAEHLQRVAEVYQAAILRAEPPTRAVEKQLHTSRSNAGRWVLEARRRGLLPPTKPGVAKAQEPTRQRAKGAKSRG
jgi:hypothetical protein